MLFILALSNTPVQVGICYPHITDEEYETPDVKWFIYGWQSKG